MIAGRNTILNFVSPRRRLNTCPCGLNCYAAVCGVCEHIAGECDFMKEYPTQVGAICSPCAHIIAVATFERVG